MNLPAMDTGEEQPHDHAFTPDAQPIDSPPDDVNAQHDVDLGQVDAGARAETDVNNPFWAAHSEEEKNLQCEQCGLGLKADLTTAGIEPGGWTWIVFDTMQRLHHTRISNEGDRHSCYFSPDEIFEFVNTYYAGSTREWELAIHETLKSNPLLFVAHDPSNLHFTIRRSPPQDERLEELAIYALSNNGEQGAPEPSLKRKVSEDGSESGPDAKRQKREKTVICFVPGCEKAYTRLDSFKQHLAKAHEGWSYDSTGCIRDPEGRSVGVFEYYASKPRRKLSEVTRNYPCPVPGCNKLYSTEQIAKTHMRKYHKGVEIPKRIDPLTNPDEELMQHQHVFNPNYAMYSAESIQAAMKPPQSTSEHQTSYQVRTTPTPQLRTQPYNPNLSYSFTAIPTTNFFAALTQQHHDGPAPSSTPFDWNQLNRYISNSLAGEQLDHGSEHQQHVLPHDEHGQQPTGMQATDLQSTQDNNGAGQGVFSQGTDAQRSYTDSTHGEFGQLPPLASQHNEVAQTFADQSGQHQH